MPSPNERFGVMAAEARRNGSANLKVCTPQKVQWKPPLRQAAIPLCAIWGHTVVDKNENIIDFLPLFLKKIKL